MLNFKVSNASNAKSLVSILLIFSMLMYSISVAYALPSINIYTEKEIYSYGDTLTFTIEVSEVTGDFAILYIIDDAGKKSSAIPISVTDSKTVVPSPFPFESTVYPQGKYTLEIQYSESSDTTEFELIDSGNIVIPIWIRELSKYWYNGEISDLEFANGIEFLINEGIIVVPQTQSQETTNEAKIPDWVKTSTGWWIDGFVSDREYASALEYLIKVQIIIV